jgi:hypothetical protein
MLAADLRNGHVFPTHWKIGTFWLSQTDYGIMCFVDARFSRADKRTKLPQWIQRKIKPAHQSLSANEAVSVRLSSTLLLFWYCLARRACYPAVVGLACAVHVDVASTAHCRLIHRLEAHMPSARTSRFR